MNPFDQFDAAPAAPSSNPFDQFDAPQAQAPDPSLLEADPAQYHAQGGDIEIARQAFRKKERKLNSLGENLALAGRIPAAGVKAVGDYAGGVLQNLAVPLYGASNAASQLIDDPLHPLDAIRRGFESPEATRAAVEATSSTQLGALQGMQMADAALGLGGRVKRLVTQTDDRTDEEIDQKFFQEVANASMSNDLMKGKFATIDPNSTIGKVVNHPAAPFVPLISPTVLAARAVTEDESGDTLAPSAEEAAELGAPVRAKQIELGANPLDITDAISVGAFLPAKAAKIAGQAGGLPVKAIGKTLQAVGRGVDKIAAGRAGTAAGLAAAAVTGHIPEAIAGLAAKKAIPAAGNILREVGDELLGAAPKLATSAGEVAYRGAKDVIKGAIHGATTGTAFAILTTDSAEEFVEQLGSGVGLGVFGGLNQATDLSASSNKQAKAAILEETGKRLEYGLGLDSEHAAQVARLTPEDQAAVNKMRGFTAGLTNADGTPIQVLVVSGPTFSQVTGDTTAASRGAYDAGGTIYINADRPKNQLGQAGETLAHEAGHMAEELVQMLAPKFGEILTSSLDSALTGPNGAPTKAFANFIAGYQAKKGDANFDARSEFIAETTRKILEGQGIESFALPPAVADRVKDAVKDFGKRLGLGRGKDDTFNWKEAPQVTTALRKSLYEIGRTAPSAVAAENPNTSTRIRQIDARLTAIRATPQAQQTPEMIDEAAKLQQERAKLAKGVPVTASQPGPVPSPSTAPAAPEATADPYADVGLNQSIADAVRDYHVAPPGMEPTTQRANSRKGVAGKSADRIAEERAAEWDAMFSAYLDDVRESGLEAPADPTQLHQDVIAHSLQQGAYQGANPPAAPAPAPADTAAPVLSDYRDESQPQEERGALEPEPATSIKSKWTPETVTQRLAEAETDTRVSPAFAKKKDEKLVRAARLNVLLEMANEDAGGQDLLQRRERNGRVTYSGRLDTSLPSHRALLEESGMDSGTIGIVEQISENLGKTVKLDYRSAVNRLPGDTSSKQRSQEYRESSAESRRSGGDAFEAKGKPFMPTGFIVSKAGAVNVRGFSPERFTSNAAKLLTFMQKQGMESGYSGINDPQLTSDMRSYVENHRNGYKGDGSGPIEGATVNPNYDPDVIPRNRFDLLNASMHADISTKIASNRADTRASAMDAQSRALENSWEVDYDTGDTNPLRAAINRSGQFKARNEEGKERTGTGEILEPVWETLSPELISNINDTTERSTVRPDGFEGDFSDVASTGLPDWRNVESGFMPDDDTQTSQQDTPDAPIDAKAREIGFKLDGRIEFGKRPFQFTELPGGVTNKATFTLPGDTKPEAVAGLLEAKRADFVAKQTASQPVLSNFMPDATEDNSSPIKEGDSIRRALEEKTKTIQDALTPISEKLNAARGRLTKSSREIRSEAEAASIKISELGDRIGVAYDQLERTRSDEGRTREAYIQEVIKAINKQPEPLPDGFSVLPIVEFWAPPIVRGISGTQYFSKEEAVSKMGDTAIDHRIEPRPRFAVFRDGELKQSAKESGKADTPEEAIASFHRNKAQKSTESLRAYGDRHGISMNAPTGAASPRLQQQIKELETELAALFDIRESAEERAKASEEIEDQISALVREKAQHVGRLESVSQAERALSKGEDDSGTPIERERRITQALNDLPGLMADAVRPYLMKLRDQNAPLAQEQRDTESAESYLRDEDSAPGHHRHARMVAKERATTRERDAKEREYSALWSDLMDAKYGDSNTKLSRLWKQVSKGDSAFLFPATKSRIAAIIARDMSVPGHEMTGVRSGDDILFETENGSLTIQDAYGDEPTILAASAGSSGKKQGGGAQLYQAALAWAHNNGVKIHPSNQLTAINRYVRRTSNMLSSALRFGTTKHMAPDRDQGVKWKPGRDGYNIAQLALREMAQVFKALPQLEHVDFDFDSGKMRNADGAEFTPEDLEAFLKGERENSFDRGIGRSTAQRAIITASALRAFEPGADKSAGGGISGREPRVSDSQGPVLYMPDSTSIKSKSPENQDETMQGEFLIGHEGRRNRVDRQDSFRDSRAIKAAALRMEDGEIFTGSTHATAIYEAFEDGYSDDQVKKSEKGFVDGDFNFLDTVAARTRAVSIGQVGNSRLQAAQESKGFTQDDWMESRSFNEQRNFMPDDEIHPALSNFTPDADEYVPAIKVGGEVVRGNRGNTHQEVLKRFTVENPDRAAEAWADFDTDENPNFFMRGDEQVTREQLKDDLGVSDSQGLKRLQALSSFDPESMDTEKRSGVALMPDTDQLGFYSALRRAVESKLPARASAEQILATLDPSKSGVKKDELDWIGLPEFLAGKKTVTKQELLDFIDSNKVEMKEVVKGASTDQKAKELRMAIENGIRDTSEDDLDPDEYPSYAEDARRMIKNGEKALKLLDKDDYEAAAELARDNSNIEGEYGDDPAWGASRRIADGEEASPWESERSESTKFSQYQLPGGENYKEVLLTLPIKNIEYDLPSNWTTRKEDGAYGIKWKVFDEEGHYYAGGSTKAEAEQTAKNSWYKNKAGETRDQQQGFTSSHWDEPNVLAHIRQADHTDADGNSVRLIEEIQSDWHQKGRKEGYKPDDSELKKAKELSDSAHDEYKRLLKAQDGYEITPEIEQANAKFRDAFNKYKALEQGGVPDAPFKKSWHEVAFKRALRQAVEDGMDKIAWTPGEQQAERYDLSKQVSAINYDKNPDGTYTLEAAPLTRGPSHQIGDRITQDKLADYVGKEIAQKIINDTGSLNPESYGPSKTIKGENLKVGGEGMKGFYDKILPDFVRKYVKKWGGKVETTGLETDAPKNGSTFEIFHTEEDAKTWANENLGDHDFTVVKNEGGLGGFILRDEWTHQFVRSKQEVKVHSVTITPEMRAAVQGGQAMFMPDEKNLVGVHNLTAENLRHVIRMGGLAAPSLAVVRSDKSKFDGFGEITLIGSLDLVDPRKNKDARAFNADIYSPRYPRVVITLAPGDARKLSDDFDSVRAEISGVEPSSWTWNPDSIVESIQSNGFDDIRYNSLVGYAFLRDRGVLSAADGRDLSSWELGDKVSSEMRPFRDELAQWMRDRTEKLGIKPKERIFDGFTNSGNRRYLAHDLDTVVKILKRGLKDGEGFNYGVPSIRAKVAKKYPSLDAMKKDRESIISKEDMETVKKDTDAEFLELADRLIELRENKLKGFGSLDAISDDFKSMADRDYQRLRKMYGDNYKDALAIIVPFLEKLKNLPTEYFESKIRRAVQLQEFDAAVVPDGTPEELTKELERRGISVATYTKGDLAARRDAVERLSRERGANFMADDATSIKSKSSDPALSSMRAPDDDEEPALASYRQ